MVHAASPVVLEPEQEQERVLEEPLVLGDVQEITKKA